MFSFSRITLLANGVLLGFTMLVGAVAVSAEDHVSVPSRPGVTEPILYQAAATPVASVVLFPGGNGALAGLSGNFLMRVRDQFSAQGISVAVMDVPSDRGAAPTGYRSSPAAAADLKPVIEFLKQKAAVPVWLVGTSAGSISAANGAARLGPAQVSGLVLTSSVWKGGMELVPLAEIAVPTLVIHNHDDACQLSPPSGAEPAVATMTKAPVKELVFVSGGGSLRGDQCDARTAHGYYGIENRVVPAIIAWIKAHNRAATP